MTAEVDVNIPRFNQACTAALTAIAFVIPWWPLVTIVAVILLVTRVGGPGLGVFTQLYVRTVQPRLSGPVETEPIGPPRFAQLLGIVILFAATLCFVAGAETVGWVLTLTVTGLATLAAATRVCVGCIIYNRATT